MSPSKTKITVFIILGILIAAPAGIVIWIVSGGNKRPIQEVPIQEEQKNAVNIDVAFEPESVGFPIEGRPWVPHLAIEDLDQDGLLDILVCDGVTDKISWIQQSPINTFKEYVLAENVKGPAHVDATDMDGDGDLDLLIASMGVIRPNNDKIGSVVILENDGNQQFERHVLVENIARVTDVRAADFDGDMDLDLVVGQFGYSQGEIRWMENRGDWNFESHILLGLSGTVHTPVADIDNDGDMDFVALVSQEWEEIHLFENDGDGRFHDRILWGSTNEDYGSSGLKFEDFDRDGDLDILYTNGDGFDYAKPGPRPWHGMQWLENRGNGFFKFHRISDYPGAYSPVSVDLNGDSFLDLVAVASVNRWEDLSAVSMMAWINDGNQRFTQVPLAHSPTHLIVADSADLDGDGVPEIVTGGLHAYPPYGHLSRVTIWRKTTNQ